MGRNKQISMQFFPHTKKLFGIVLRFFFVVIFQVKNLFIKNVNQALLSTIMGEALVSPLLLERYGPILDLLTKR